MLFLPGPYQDSGHECIARHRYIAKPLVFSDRVAVDTKWPASPSIFKELEVFGNLGGQEGGTKSKSGDIRVIYHFHSEMMPVYLLAVFGTNEKSNITAEEKNLLSKAVKELVVYWRQRNEQGIH